LESKGVKMTEQKVVCPTCGSIYTHYMFLIGEQSCPYCRKELEKYKTYFHTNANQNEEELK
jgi:uncharacterized protein YbaR (Trm112 family)